ncbi:gastrula zinc finger protein XlCGF28.1-like [Diorhabda carinulata]|uniref:gastrula zinc finger protein XlCGF28.1-like n=1 Tax=Diorhabda carinulata TaxID=1163345 RepID=UPI0025A1F31C|nr:gastrula zinc finger protein XlCGF28.1-like [Diorhabda carinulata]
MNNAKGYLDVEVKDDNEWKKFQLNPMVTVKLTNQQCLLQINELKNLVSIKIEYRESSTDEPNEYLVNLSDLTDIKKETGDCDIKTKLLTEEINLPPIKNESHLSEVFVESPTVNQLVSQDRILKYNRRVAKLKKKKKLFNCLVCMKTFKTSSSRNDHFNKHFGNTCVVCQLCGKLFVKKNSYMHHYFQHCMQVRTKRKSFFETTTKQFESLEEKVRTDKYSVTKFFKCERCSKIYQRYNYFEAHLKSHDSNKYFIQKSRRTSNHSDKKMFNCDTCMKNFTRYWNLRDHMKIHTGEEPFECHVCGRTFRAKRQLRRHVLTHTAEKSFECTYCSKRFTRRDNLHNHYRIHTNEKPFKCDICSKHFRIKHHLKRHLQQLHDDKRLD